MTEPLRLVPASRREWLLPVGFALVILLTVGVGFAIGTVVTGEPTLLRVVYRPILFPGLFTVAPVVLGAVHTLRGGSLAGVLAVGVAPGLAFLVLAWSAELTGVSSGGDAPAWGLAVVFAAAGVAGALSGTAVVVAVRIGRERLGVGE